jgi:hypothetical protein
VFRKVFLGGGGFLIVENVQNCGPERGITLDCQTRSSGSYSDEKSS